MIRFLNPNYHVVLIHYPIALLGIGLLIEVLGFLWPRSTIRAAARWMILLGALGTVPAATSGIFAKYDILSQNAGVHGGDWIDVRAASHLSGLQWKFLNDHVLYNAVASAVAVLAVILWLGGSDRWRRGLYIPALLLLFISMGLMVYGAYNGGEMVYRTRFATKDPSAARAEEENFQRDLNASDHSDKLFKQIDYYVDPLQAHIIGAGLVFAFAAGSLGMSLRKSSQVRLLAVSDPMDVESVPATPAEPVQTGRVVRTTVIDDELAPLPDNTVVPDRGVVRGRVGTRAQVVGVAAVRTPASRFWLFVTLAALLTAAGGWYLIAHDHPKPLDFKEVFNAEIWGRYKTYHMNGARMLAHLIGGGAIILLAILLSMVSRWGVRNRVIVSFFGLLLAAASAAQITIGTLMLYDSDTGPLNRFKTKEDQAADAKIAETAETGDEMTKTRMAGEEGMAAGATSTDKSAAPTLTTEMKQAADESAKKLKDAAAATEKGVKSVLPKAVSPAKVTPAATDIPPATVTPPAIPRRTVRTTPPVVPTTLPAVAEPTTTPAN